jgi:nucleoside-diphosphate-sugar epimerase
MGLMGERLLVTGATGFLGQEICRRLVERGAQVRALVRPGAPATALEALGVAIHRGDLRETWSLDGVARDIDIILHVAAVYRGGAIRRTDFWQINAEGTKRLLHEAARHHVRRFVYVSTAGIHGNVRPGRLATESDPARPRDLYELTKWRGEQAVRRIAHSDRIEAVIVRPSAIYGPGERRFLKLFRPIASRRFVLIGSGRTRVHFIHRDDAVDGIIAAAMAPQSAGEAFLLADRSPIATGDLVQAISTLLGVPPPRFRVPYTPVKLLAMTTEALCRPLRLPPPLYRRRLAFFGTDRAYATEKARAILGFQPRVELAAGLLELANWYRKENLL